MSVVVDSKKAIKAYQEKGLYRKRVVQPVKEYSIFNSNDYLGLKNSPEIKAASIAAIEEFGLGSGSAQLIAGYSSIHQTLEQRLAHFFDYDKALLFPSGYQANCGVISTLAKLSSVIIQDKANHASLIDGATLSGVRSFRFHHQNLSHLEHRLAQHPNENTKLVITEGLFSMQGDIAKLHDIATLCETHNALLVLDDAHGIGVLGNTGRGTLETHQLNAEKVPVLLGTFGKAFGSGGAFVCANETLIDYLEQFCRPFIYTTAIAPPLVAASLKSLEIITHSPERVKQLKRNVAALKAHLVSYGFDIPNNLSPIIPIKIGSNDKTMKVAASLKEAGILVGAIRPPTVPPEGAMLRISVSASHTEQELQSLAKVLAHLLIDDEVSYA